MNESACVCAVVVTYHPQRDTLAELLCAASPQVGGVLIVDNGSPPETLSWFREHDSPRGIELLELGDNLGVAAAHNRGIAWARQHGFSFVLLLDQDSVAAPDMVAKLLAGYRRLSQRRRVAAVGPKLCDPRTGETAPFVQFGWLRNQHLPCRAGCDQLLRADFLISSGMLIPLSVIDSVGDMDEGLFIDNVDMEWSFRVKWLGFRLYGVCDAHLRHTIGDRIQRCAGFRVVRHAPLRLYYIMRNRIQLYRRPYTSASWIARDIVRSACKFLASSLLLSPRGKNAQMMCRGIWHGVTGRTGRYDLARARKKTAA